MLFSVDWIVQSNRWYYWWISFEFNYYWLMFFRFRWMHKRTGRVKCGSRIPAKTNLQGKEMLCLMTPATPRGS